MKKHLFLLCLAGLFFTCTDENMDNGSLSTEGTGSSLARFTIKNDYLYIVNDQSLYSINITSPENPTVSNHVEIGWGIETIYPYYDYLLIGSFNAMYIYSVADDPSSPAYVSRFAHWEACDPVVAQGNFAYVTLRSGSRCSPWSPNQLDVVDISNPQNPVSAGSLQMQNPHGLAVSGNTLLVCEGTYGLAWVDITDPAKPVLDSLYKEFHAYDVIIRNNLVIVTGDDGYFQFDLSEGYLKKISEILYL